MSDRRKFVDAPAEPNDLPFSFAVTGYAGAGKTLSTLLLMQGVQRVKGGDIWVVDTDNRSQEYARIVPHRRISMGPPYSPVDFQAAASHAFKHGARMIIVDNMSDEHDGEGGILDMRAADPSKGLDAWNPIKAKRKAWERWVISRRNQDDVVWGFTYRAELKYRPKSKDDKVREQTEDRPRDPTDHEWAITSTSGLAFACSLRFLLPLGSDGHPLLKGTTADEKYFIKSTCTFDPYLATIQQLNADVGQKLYELAKGRSTREKPAQPRARKPLSFSDRYKGASGPIADADEPMLDEYLRWLADEPQSAQRDAHIEAVQAVFARLAAGEAT